MSSSRFPSMAAAATLLCAGCSIDDTPDLPMQEGIFLDSPVEGLAYSGGRFTGTGGSYEYNPDAVMQFSIGDIDVGGLFLPRTTFEGRLVTPVSLFPNSTPNSLSVLNVVRFLLTIDFDSNPDNGILILPELHPAAAELSIDFEGDFETEANVALEAFAGALGGVRTLVDFATASEHLSTSLISTISGPYSGSYTVTENGEPVVVGTVDIVLTRAGEICGFLRETGEDPTPLTGNSSFTVEAGGMFNDDAMQIFFGGNIVEDVFAGTYGGPAIAPGLFELELADSIDFFLGPPALEFVGTYVGRIGQGEEIGILVEPNGDLSLADPQVCGTILRIDGTAARFHAVSVVGDVLTGTIEDGEMTGVSTSSGGSVAFTLVRQ